MKTTTRLMTAMLTWMVSSALFIASAANTEVTVSQVSSSVDITDAVDYVITSSTPFATAGSVNIVNTESAVVRFSNVKPSLVIKNWMDNIFINGEKAVNGTNCQVRMYSRGAIVFPYDRYYRPLTCYTEQNFEGDSYNNYTEGHSGGYMKSLNATTLNNKIRSFKLKRGYMVTFAIGAGGWGYSRCFIADQEDLEFATLPAVLDNRISSYRLFQWYNFGKQGLASNGSSEACQLLNVQGCYDWAEGNASNLPDTEWVPNHIYEDWPSSSTCGSATWSCHMKTNNEPGNSADDHPQDVNTVLANWQNLMRTGLRLCSESSHDGSMNHLKQFIDSIDARGWRCDILDMHCYWTGNFNNLGSYSSNYGKGRPVWVSEWIWGASWNNNGCFSPGRTDAEILSNTKNILSQLNNSDIVERYFYWNSESKGHICERKTNADGSTYWELTNLGKYYSTMETGLGYKKKNEYIPKNPRYESIDTLHFTYASTKGTVNLSWKDPNGDLMNSITVQCKLPDQSLWTTVAEITPKDKSSSAGATYLYTDTVSEPGTYTYRIKEVWFTGSATYFTNEVTVNVAPARGTSEFQHGRLTLDNEEELTTVFSDKFDATPVLFLGTMTNSNTNYYAGNFLKSVTSRNFIYQMMPWKTNPSSTLSKSEELPFFALKQGSYTFKGHNGSDLQCEVGIAKSAKSSVNLWSDTTEVVFENPFPEDVVPVVLTEIRNPALKTTVFSTRIFDVTNTGFKFIVYTENSTGVKVTTAKNVEYMAITPGVAALDAENSLYIAAGHGVDSKIYGSAVRENLFRIKNPEEGADSLQLYLSKPSILTNLQTNNYPTLAMLRRVDTKKDVNGTKWSTGVKVKKIHDHPIQVDGKTVSITTTSEPYRDELGWVCISDHILIGPDMEELNIATAIDAPVVEAKTIDANMTVYNLSGQAVGTAGRLGQLPRGIYIVGGKKVVK